MCSYGRLINVITAVSDRQTGKQRERERQRETETETQTQTDRQTDRDRETERANTIPPRFELTRIAQR